MALSTQQGEYLVRTARRVIETTVVQRSVPTWAELPKPEGPGGFLDERRGAFVTLTKAGGLRGCIGVPYPTKPLGIAIIEAASGAATRDPRFDPVRPAELPSIMLEVSALTAPVAIPGQPDKRHTHVMVGRDGLIVSGRGTGGLLLPQVATDFDVDAPTFLAMTCEKAGLPNYAWLSPDVQVSRFQAEVFSEASSQVEEQVKARR